MEAVPTFDGGVVEADNLRGLRNTCTSHKPPPMDSSAEIWTRRPKADPNETGASDYNVSEGPSTPNGLL